MLKKPFFIVLLLFTSIKGMAHSTQLSKINPENIKKYHAQIAYTFKRGSLVKKAALGTAVLGLSYLLYKMTVSLEGSVASGPKPTLTQGDKDKIMSNFIEMCNKTEEKNQKINDLLDRVLKIFADNGYYAAGERLSWGQWAGSWGSWFARMFTLSFVGGVASLSLSPLSKYFKALDAAVDKGVNRIFPDCSINWYLTTHANLPMAFNDLNRQAVQLDKLGDQDTNAEFVSSWQVLVDQVERILGYIFYRNESFGPLLKERGKQMSINLIALINQKAESVLAISPESYAAWIGGLRTELDEELHAFLEVEQIDRAQ